MLLLLILYQNFLCRQKGSPSARVSLAEVFHPWVRWEGPGTGFVRPALAPAPPAGNLGCGPLGIDIEKHGFRPAWLIEGLKSDSSILTF